MNEEIKNEETTEGEEFITLINDEDGTEMNFLPLSTVEYDDEWYIVLLPQEECDCEHEEGCHCEECEHGEDEEEVVIFKLDEDEEGNTLYLPVEDEELLNKVFDKFMEEYEEENG